MCGHFSLCKTCDLGFSKTPEWICTFTFFRFADVWCDRTEASSSSPMSPISLPHIFNWPSESVSTTSRSLVLVSCTSLFVATGFLSCFHSCCFSLWVSGCAHHWSLIPLLEWKHGKHVTFLKGESPGSDLVSSMKSNSSTQSNHMHTLSSPSFVIWSAFTPLLCT